MSERKLHIIKTEDGSNSLYVPELKETYHSFHGAVQESRHVFIEHGLTFFNSCTRKEPIKILEVGLGTGLNALLVTEWAYKARLNVEMTSLEAYPVAVEMALSLNHADYIKVDSANEWFAQIHKSPWGKLENISDHFKLQKIESKLEEVALKNDFDVVFFDAFAPNKQSELWELPILKKTYEALCKSGVFVTYCAKGQLKRDLKSLGFEVETLVGPPGKKEMVRGVKA
ncbi:methyltransferase [Fulvivirga sp. RKSG066]|uniref:tRNA (5-methylaminomethyl-2-thiouridine)(34)-methyltransferase MnmD n=1 Tax=Fulvivirga aurantia TaxID=2529383 RepID=UPI0012BB7AC3|nr:tRNA (5-methylaminomethyl-2-thiouridine)(34)-methyltransferase MnmD [Fulvivirga aurantia]MTI22896.1 methyltransferase [Fulvivirga aurantia]